MNTVWARAQKQELIFWMLQKYPMLRLYKEKYQFFDSFLNVVDKQNTKVLDLGCGALPVTSMFTFKDLTLCDSLMQEYLKLPKEQANLGEMNAIRIQAKGEELPFPSDYFDVIFFLNVLDHVEVPIQVLTELLRVLKVSGHLLLFCDLKSIPDECHPHCITRDLIVKTLLLKTTILTEESKVRDAVLGYYSIFKKLC